MTTIVLLAGRNNCCRRSFQRCSNANHASHLARRLEKAVEAILATEIGRKCAALKDAQGRVPAHLAAMSSRRDLVELLLPHSGLGSDEGLEAVMTRGKVSTAAKRMGCMWSRWKHVFVYPYKHSVFVKSFCATCMYQLFSDAVLMNVLSRLSRRSVFKQGERDAARLCRHSRQACV